MTALWRPFYLFSGKSLHLRSLHLFGLQRHGTSPCHAILCTEKLAGVIDSAGEEQCPCTSAVMANNIDDLMTKLDAGTIMFRLPSRKRGKMEKKRFCLRADTCEVHQLPVNSTSRHHYPEEICECVHNVEVPRSSGFCFVSVH